MSRHQTACIVCGYVIERQSLTIAGHRSWLSEFRIVYPDGISGVGSLHDEMTSIWRVPLDAKCHYNDAQYESEEDVSMTVMENWFPRSLPHGFPLHNSCWKLLHKFYGSDDVPLQRLYDVCLSLSFPTDTDGVDWGHAYSGLWQLNETTSYPHEDRWLIATETDGLLQTAQIDPYNVPEVSLLWETVSSVAQPVTAFTTSLKSDCFGRLPQEIIEYIAENLSLQDVKNLRLASSAFVDVFSSQAFWRSRFQSGNELDCLFEAADSRGANPNWRAAYEKVGRLKALSGFRNRMRIWRLIRLIDAHLVLHLGGTQPKIVGGEFCSPWLRVSCQTFTESKMIESVCRPKGCLSLIESSALVPKNLYRIGISVLQIADITYIVGIRLIPQNNDIDQPHLGYTTGGREFFYNTTSIHGLSLSIGVSGFHALRLVHQDGSYSKWFGNPQRRAITERLKLEEPVVALRVELDHYKIIGFSVAGAPKSHSAYYASQPLAFRDVAIWYPEIPDPKLNLNESCFWGQKPMTVEYAPINWMCFGGQDGSRLSQLVEISARQNQSEIHSIDFSYVKDAHHNYNSSQPKPSLRFGREQVRGNPLYRFHIDGPGGELITSVAVSYGGIRKNDPSKVPYCRGVETVWFETNRGRSHSFTPSRPEAMLVRLDITPGTTIVGFYGRHAKHHGLVDLGVISVPLPPQKKD